MTPRPRVAPRRPPAPPAEVDWTNRQKPTPNDPELARQGESLFGAVARGRPSEAAGFFFPRKPFTPLKQAGDPDRYWQHIYRLYERDILRWHRKRTDWNGATFHSLELGTKPEWIRPGRVHNKIGYYRSKWSKLRYRMKKRLWTIYIHTLITWQGRWYVTHLRPPSRRRRATPRRPPRKRPVP